MSTISAIIPTYNRADLVQQAIDSLLQQTHLPDEIIVVDDGSTDNTADVLAKYGSAITIISQPNRGLPAARNAGLQVATGDLIVFLDSDDVLPPTSHARFMKCFGSSPEIVVAYSDVKLIDLEGNELGLLSQHHPVSRPSGMIFGELALHNLFPPHAAMVRRSSRLFFFEDKGLKGCEDYDLWLRLSADHPFAYINEPLAHYRLHGNSMTQSNLLTMGESEIEAQRRAMETTAFQRLATRDQARIYCSHGVKNAMIGRMNTSRQCFLKAIRTCPTFPTGYVLTLSSLLGERFLRFMVLARRRAVGNRSWQEILEQTNVSRP